MHASKNNLLIRSVILWQVLLVSFVTLLKSNGVLSKCTFLMFIWHKTFMPPIPQFLHFFGMNIKCNFLKPNTKNMPQHSLNNVRRCKCHVRITLNEVKIASHNVYYKKLYKIWVQLYFYSHDRNKQNKFQT
jgi:hypothetical protein